MIFVKGFCLYNSNNQKSFDVISIFNMHLRKSRNAYELIDITNLSFETTIFMALQSLSRVLYNNYSSSSQNRVISSSEGFFTTQYCPSHYIQPICTESSLHLGFYYTPSSMFTYMIIYFQIILWFFFSVSFWLPVNLFL